MEKTTQKSKNDGTSINSIKEDINEEKNNQQLVEIKKKSPEIPSWMIALGVGATIAAAAAVTVYYVKSRRNEELDALKFGSDEDELNSFSDFHFKEKSTSFFSYFSTESISNYWGITKKGLNTVSSFLRSLSSDNDRSPLVDSEEASKSDLFNTNNQSDQDLQ